MSALGVTALDRLSGGLAFLLDLGGEVKVQASLHRLPLRLGHLLVAPGFHRGPS
jgi:hypothetical protein